MYNIADSVLFLKSARQALSGLVEISNTADKKYVKEMTTFINKEATDYQVMSLMMTGKLPEEKHNFVKESELFQNFQVGLLENYDKFSNTYGEKITDSLVFEVGPVSNLGIDTASPVLDHLRESGILRNIMEQNEKEKESTGKKAMDAGMSAAGAIGAGATLKDAAKGAYKLGKKGVAKGKEYAGKGFAKGKEYAKKVGPSAGKVASKVGSKVVGAAKAGTVGAYQQAKKGVSSLKALRTTSKLGPAARGMIQPGDKAAAIKNVAAGAGKMLGTAAIVAAAIYAGYKVYKNYLSKAARACKGAPNKNECMKNYRNQGIKAQIAAVQGGMSKCSSSKDPAKCKQAIANKVQSLQSKIK